MYTSGMGTMEMRFADLGDIYLDNEGLASLKPFIYLVIGMTFVAQIGTGIFDLVVWGALMALCCWGPFRLKGTEKVSFKRIMILGIYAQTAGRLATAFNASAGLIPGNYIVYYAGMMAAMFLLMSGLRKLEGKADE